MTPLTSASLAPLIKWPGGKRRELGKIEPFIPGRFDRYVEPFFGGGAVFFRLSDPHPSILNDANPDLMAFYGAVQRRDPAFFEHARSLATDWARLGEVAERVTGVLGESLKRFRRRPVPLEVVRSALPHSHAIDRSAPPTRDRTLSDTMAASVTNRLRRVQNLERKHAVTFTAEQIDTHVETAIRAGYYTYVRDAGPLEHEGERAAEFFFIREFCYGAMFRFNRDGKFNIPYGGIAYNKKPFAARVTALTSDAVQDRLSNAELFCRDFAEVIEHAAPTAGDFVFLDPPYDSDFSSYGNRAFTLADHERLADRLARLRAAWLLVIKKTPDVERIYGPLAVRGGASRREFDKSYTYNVRGRNDRNAVHLILSRSPRR